MSPWPDHRGQPLAGAVFWHPPDPRIGQVLSAGSNQGPDARTKRVGGLARLWVSLLSLAAIIDGLLLIGLDDVGVAFAWICGGGGTALVFVALLAATFRRPGPECNYVGEDGFCEHRVWWFGREIHQVVRFAEVDGLWISAVDHYTNGMYEHSDTHWTWREEGGRMLFHRMLRTFERGLPALVAPDASEEQAFMQATHVAWNAHRQARAERHLAEVGAAVFRLSEGYATVRREGVELYRQRERKLFGASSVDRVVVADGQLTIEVRAAGHKAGTTSVPTSEIADVTVFLATIHTVARIPVFTAQKQA